MTINEPQAYTREGDKKAAEPKLVSLTMSLTTDLSVLVSGD